MKLCQLAKNRAREEDEDRGKEGGMERKRDQREREREGRVKIYITEAGVGRKAINIRQKLEIK